ALAFQSLPGYLLGTSSIGALTGVSGPSGAPTATQLANPAGLGTVWLITPNMRYTSCPGNSAAQGCVGGAGIEPGLTPPWVSVPLVEPMTEFGDRINQLDLNIARTFKVGTVTVQPKIDFFNLLNVAPVYSVNAAGGLNFGTPIYMQPASVLNGRTFQLGGIV